MKFSRRWTSTGAVSEYAAMRWELLLAGLTIAALQAGCGTTPRQLGITGPGPQVQPQLTPDDATVLPPGLSDPNTTSGAEQRFYHYN